MCKKFKFFFSNYIVNGSIIFVLFYRSLVNNGKGIIELRIKVLLFYNF